MIVKPEKLKALLIEVLQEVLDVPRPFNCNRCPRNADKERGPWCPAWGSILLTERHSAGTETKVVEACYFERMEKWHEGIRHMVSMNVDSINAVRSETAQSVESQDRILLGLQHLFSGAKSSLPTGKGQDSLEYVEGDSETHGRPDTTEPGDERQQRQ